MTLEMSGRGTSIFVLVLIVFQLTFVQGQFANEGFLNIDCGLPKGRTYNDAFLGLQYISDCQSVSPNLFVADSPISYLRSFPKGTRNCYKIKPVVEGWKYLVRARFMYGNYDELDKFPQFDVHLGINYWETLHTQKDVSKTYNSEIIEVAVSNSISVCLVNTNQGMPFISATEMRHLPNTLYSEITSQSLAIIIRQNLGGVYSRDLSSNSLTGEIPDFLSGLAQLKVLNLANNSLTGSIPKVLLDMSSKGQLNLSTGGNPNLCFNPDSSCPEERSKKNNKVLTVVGSCIGVVIVLASLIIFVCWIYCKRKSRDGNQIEVEEMRKFKYDEVKEITDNFKEEIGSGGYGQVFLGKLGNRRIAVKVLKKFSKSTKGLEGFQTEAKLLSKIHHRNLVPLIGYCDDDIKHLALVYEYMEGGSLHDHLSGQNNMNPLSWNERLRIAREAAEGLMYLHKGCKPPIIHRDIKPANILLTENLAVCIADFGLSKMFEDDGISHMSTTGYAGTGGYLDPEYQITKKLRTKSDIYSFGVVLLNLITGIPATIDGEVISDIVSWIQQRRHLGEELCKSIFDKKINEVDSYPNSVLKLANLAKKCTKSKAGRRPNITKVVAGLEACFENSHNSGVTSHTEDNVLSPSTQEDVLLSGRRRSEAEV